MIAGVPITNIIRSARRAKQQTGKGIVSQLFDIVRLRLHGHGILPDVYYDMRLFEPSLSWVQKTEYVGSWIKPLLYRIQSPDATALFSDKLRALAFFRDHSLATPDILAATHPNIEISGVKALCSPSELREWLLTTAPFPLFCKPSISYRGYGNKLIRSIEHGTEIHFGDGSTESLDIFVETHGRPGTPTLIFQKMLQPHPAISAVTGARLATARVMVLNDRPVPEIYRAGLRIPSGSSMIDNFRGGSTGNLLARLDVDTGAVKDVLSSIGLDWQTTARHPDTGESFAGFTVPDWSQAMELVLHASRLAPELKIHNWDVAFTDAGPMLIEDNPNGDLVLVQVVAARGLATPRFLELYKNQRIR
ncbi:sugar-transfer associated ATP-grasp domain-containing protein [Sphingosinicella sp.]|jgi:hypothetical protein|uniref:sugar-transfer associated ATP-grasp domain-containing protein n=1 Tax=Sphingosinicella sp. TaxID=1917971 RepID=UPI002625C135|nr:sugar-transfer associated ATP-grasp domain-containing protein [Sphingosinicella sp.]